MSPANRFEQRKEHTRQQLLDAAERVFSELGYTAASITDITEAADVSKRTFYLHFKDKEELIGELAHMHFETVRQKIDDFFENKPEHTVREGQYYVVKAIFEFAQKNPDLMRIVAGHDGSFRLNAMAREYMARAMALGYTKDDNHCYRPDANVPLDILANILGGATFQLLCWSTENPGLYTPDQIANMFNAVFFDSVSDLFDETESEPGRQVE